MTNETMKDGERAAFDYAKRLAEGIWERCYRDDAPQWKPLDDMLGILTQIDNMIAGMARAASPQSGEKVDEPIAYTCDAGLKLLRDGTADASVWSKAHAQPGDTALYLRKQARAAAPRAALTDDAARKAEIERTDRSEENVTTIKPEVKS